MNRSRSRLFGLVAAAALASCLLPMASVSAAAPASPKYYWLNACHLKQVPDLKLRAGHALRAHIKWEASLRHAGFSQCVFVSGNGTFVVLDITDTFMLSKLSGHSTTALQEFDRVDRVGGFPKQLLYINHKHTQFLYSHVWEIGLRGDVLGLATFGFFHKVAGHLPAFSDARPRIYIFLNNRVMPHFKRPLVKG